MEAARAYVSAASAQVLSRLRGRLLLLVTASVEEWVRVVCLIEQRGRAVGQEDVVVAEVVGRRRLI